MREKIQGLKNLNVPNLRFPEFSEDWVQTTIGEIGNIKNGPFGSVLHAEDYVSNGVPIVTTEHFKFGTLPTISEGIPQVSDEDYIRLKGYVLNENDIVFSRVGSVEINALVGKKQSGWLFSGRVLRVRPMVKINPLCLHYVLSTESVKKDIRNRAVGQTMPSINTPILSKTALKIPNNIIEQNKIASLLSLLDNRIATQNKIIQQLQSLIKGIVVEHYNKSHQTKFKIKDLGRSYSVMNMSKEDLSETGIECIIYGELFTTYDCVATNIVSKTEKAIQTSTVSTGYDLLFPASTTVDAQSLIAPTAISQPNIILGGDMFGIVVDKKYNNEYLSYIFNYLYKNHLARYAQGSTIIHLHYNDIKNLDIELPDINTQNELVLLLQNMQYKIHTEKKMLSMLETQKAYLLKNLFI